MSEYQSVFELAKAVAKEPSPRSAFNRIFEVYSSEVKCSVGEKLAMKYGTS